MSASHYWKLTKYILTLPHPRNHDFFFFLWMWKFACCSYCWLPKKHSYLHHFLGCIIHTYIFSPFLYLLKFKNKKTNKWHLVFLFLIITVLHFIVWTDENVHHGNVLLFILNERHCFQSNEWVVSPVCLRKLLSLCQWWFSATFPFKLKLLSVYTCRTGVSQHGKLLSAKQSVRSCFLWWVFFWFFKKIYYLWR